MQSVDASLSHLASRCRALPNVGLIFALSRQWRHLLSVTVGFSLMFADNLESFAWIAARSLLRMYAFRRLFAGMRWGGVS